MKNFPPMLLLLWSAFSLVALSGCWQQSADRLVGRWQGRPQQAADEESSTALEAFDFSISLHFLDKRNVKLALGEGEDNQARSGTWQVIDAAGERLTIEIDAEGLPADTDTDASADSEAAAPAREIRRFRIRFLPNDADQFTLVEAGADPSHGAILFRRSGSP